MKRTFTSMAVVALVMAQFVGGTGADAAGSCKPFRPTQPDSASSNAADAKKGKVVLVTERTTKAKPFVAEYSHGPAISDSSLGQATTGDPHSFMILEDARFFNFQLVAGARASQINARIEWGTPSVSDIDLRLYGQSGAEIDYSAAFNPLEGVTTPVFGGDDANGMEQLLGIWMGRCSGFTVESRPAWSPGEDAVTLKVWLD